VQIPAGFEAAMAEGRQQMVSIFVYGGEMKSSFGALPLHEFFSKLREDTVHERMAARQVPVHLLRPFEIQERNVAPPKKVSGNLLGSMLPYFIILLCMTGAMYPAMDLTAGEKERGTIETLLCCPVARSNLVLGKFMTVLCVSLATTLFSLLSMMGTLLVAKGALGRAAHMQIPITLAALDWQAVVMVFVMVLPVAILLSAAQLAIALFAKSFKEAQSYLSPLMILVILPAVLGMLPGMELSAKCAVIPVLNTSLICKEILMGNYAWPMMGLIFGSSCVYAAAALAGAVWLFNREEVLFRT
jgi:sodium transport system permease protein